MCDECKRSKALTVCHKLWSTNTSQEKTLQNNLWANFRQFSNRSHFSFFEMVVVKAWCCDFVSLLRCFVCWFAISFHALLGMTFHVIRLWGNIRVRFLGNWNLFYSSSRNPGFEHISVFVCNIFACFAVSLNTTQNKHGRGMMSVLPNQRSSGKKLFVSSQFMSSTYTDKNSPFSRWANMHSNFFDLPFPYYLTDNDYKWFSLINSKPFRK